MDKPTMPSPPPQKYSERSQREAAKASAFLTDAASPRGIAKVRDYNDGTACSVEKYSDPQVGVAYATALRLVHLEDQLEFLDRRLRALEERR